MKSWTGRGIDACKIIEIQTNVQTQCNDLKHLKKNMKSWATRATEAFENIDVG